MAECGHSSLTVVTCQPFVSGLNLWVVEGVFSWDDSFSSGVHDHRAVPVVGPHCSQQHTLLADATEAKSGFVLALRLILTSISAFKVDYVTHRTRVK